MSNHASSNSGARWHALVSYRTGAKPHVFEMPLEELEDLHMAIERGPHWDTVELIEIRRINHTDSPTLTLLQAEDLGKRKYKAKN